MLSIFKHTLRLTSSRSFTTRAAVLSNAYNPPATNPVHPRPNSAYAGLSLDEPQPQSQPQQPPGWRNHPITDGILGQTSKNSTPESIWKDRSRISVSKLQHKHIADAYSGRHVRVEQGKFAEAVREWERILLRNRVRATFRANERHEKKGPKRRRIRSEQWRKHFANQVRKNVQLVHKIRRRGA